MKVFIGLTTKQFDMHLSSLKRNYIKYDVYILPVADAIELSDNLFILYYDNEDSKVHYVRINEESLREIYLFNEKLWACEKLRYTDGLSRQYSLADYLNQKYCSKILLRLQLTGSSFIDCTLASRIPIKENMSVEEAVDILNSMCKLNCGGVTVEVPVLLYVILKNMSTERRKTCPIHIAKSDNDIDFPHY